MVMSKKSKKGGAHKVTTTDTDNEPAVEVAEAPAVEPEPDPFAQDVVKQLDPLELERFCRFEAEIRTCVQGMRIVDLELLEFKRLIAAKANEAQQRRALLENELNRKWKIGYDSFCEELSQKYGISKPAHMLIDTDAGTIRDSGET
jgi:hypothetical protein